MLVPAQGLRFDWRPSAELALLLLVLSLKGLAGPGRVFGRAAVRSLAVLTLVAALVNLADSAVPALLGRDLNLYWDLRHLPSLIGLAREALGWVPVTAASCGFALLAVALFLLADRAWRAVLELTARRPAALALVIGLTPLLLATVVLPRQAAPLATGFGQALARHAQALERTWLALAGRRGPYAAALARPSPPASALTPLQGRDVYVVFIESYGTTVFDDAGHRAALAGPFAGFEARLRGAGFAIASNRLVSPTFGGGSWLAHATFASGIRLDDPVLYALMLDTGRKMLPGYLGEAGWRTVDVMPGIKKPFPEGRAWGWNREIFARDLDYRGPAFGWFAIPDQFTLRRVTELRAAWRDARQIFAQIVLVSSHAPFAPVPPYLADWGDAGAFAGVSAAQWEEIRRPPDWTGLAQGYHNAILYDFRVLADWLATQVPATALVILLGDHQPPFVAGEDQPWTVPIHILSRDPALVAPFLRMGYVPGIVPSQPGPHAGMEGFLASFLAAFSAVGEQ
jgi:hypothetical protein